MNVQLKLGVIESPRGPIVEDLNFKDSIYQNRFQVRIIPEMDDISENELLPWYPTFFSDHQESFKVGDVVWIVVSEDFKVGFIVGKAQIPAGESISDLITDINTLEEECGFPRSTYSAISIDFVRDGILEFHNIYTGSKGIIYNNRTYLFFGENGTVVFKNPSVSGRINPTGEITLIGKSKKEEFTSVEEKSVEKIVESSSLKNNIIGNVIEDIGGSKQISVGSNEVESVAGDKKVFVGKSVEETTGLGESKTIVLGDYKITVLSGNISLSTVIGEVSIHSTGKISFNSLQKVSITAPYVEVSSPFVKFPGGQTSPDPGLKGPFCALPNCLFTGAPHTGNTHIGG